MKISELIQRLQYTQEAYEVGDIDVRFNVGNSQYDLDYVDLACVCTSHLDPKQTTPDFYYISFRGNKRKYK